LYDHQRRRCRRDNSAPTAETPSSSTFRRLRAVAVRVRAAAGQGEFVLNASAVNTARPALQVTTIAPADGGSTDHKAQFGQRPFWRPLSLDTIDAAICFDRVAATAFFV
jgi:hypothetical protein